MKFHYINLSTLIIKGYEIKHEISRGWSSTTNYLFDNFSFPYETTIQHLIPPPPFPFRMPLKGIQGTQFYAHVYIYLITWCITYFQYHKISIEFVRKL
jgi:hypothetical protein